MKWITWLGAAALALLSLRIAVQGGWTPYVPQFMAELQPRVAGIITGVMIKVAEEAVYALPILAMLWLAAAGYGFLIGHRLGLGRTTQVAVGMAVVLQLNWLLAWAGVLNRATALLLLAVGVGVAIWRIALWVKSNPNLAAPALPWPVLLAIPGTVLMIAAATIPPGTMWRVEAWGYDVLAYHLQLPREWMDLGRMSGLHHNVYSYLPSFVEAGYMLIGVLRGSMIDGTVTAQLFHASAALAAAWTIARIVRQVTSDRIAALIAGALLLSLPWPIITGSMAYDEMFALLFGAAAVLAVLQRDDARGAAAAGLLVGAATLTKLTAGLMFAVPVGLILLMGLQKRPLKQRITTAAVAAALGVVMLLPYFARNATDTGNPVFPFAAETLGNGHWDDALVDRWQRGHHTEASPAERGRALAYQWLCNTGYGAIFGRQRDRESAEAESQNIARFDTQWGVPLLWLCVLAAGVAARKQRLTVAMVLMLAVQIAFWLTATHLQSRFLIYTLLPALVILGLGAARLPKTWQAAGAIALAAAFSLTSFTTAFNQTQTAGDGRLPIWYLAGGMPSEAQLREDAAQGRLPGPGDHFLNRVPGDIHVYLVADNARLLYIRKPFTYHSAFDANPLGEIIGETGGAPRAVIAELRSRGITHLWIHWAELARLSATYGFDQRVNEQTLTALLDAGCRVIWQTPGGEVMLAQLPR